MESAAKRRLGDIIVERGLITAEQLDHALEVQRESGGKLGEVLVELGFITRVGLAGVITEQWDDLRVTEGGRKNAETNARSAALAGSSVFETALRAPRGIDRGARGPRPAHRPAGRDDLRAAREDRPRGRVATRPTR